MDTAETHPPAGDDAVEHAYQAGDTTFHTHVTHCNFDLINVEAEIQAHRLELHGALCNRLEESSPRKDDSVMLEPRTCSKLEVLVSWEIASKSPAHSKKEISLRNNELLVFSTVLILPKSMVEQVDHDSNVVDQIQDQRLEFSCCKS